MRGKRKEGGMKKEKKKKRREKSQLEWVSESIRINSNRINWIENLFLSLIFSRSFAHGFSLNFLAFSSTPLFFLFSLCFFFLFVSEFSSALPSHGASHSFYPRSRWGKSPDIQNFVSTSIRWQKLPEFLRFARFASRAALRSLLSDEESLKWIFKRRIVHSSVALATLRFVASQLWRTRVSSSYSTGLKQREKIPPQTTNQTILRLIFYIDSLIDWIRIRWCRSF